MTQATSQIGADQSGLAYRTADNAGKQAILNHHKGSAGPAYAEAGLIWINDSSTPWLLSVYDGADWITLGEINATNNTFQPYNGTTTPRLLPHAADTGAANAYAAAPAPAATAYAAGQLVTLKPANANTGASTLNINSLGAKNIKTLAGADPYAGALLTTGVYTLMYDGTNFILLNPSPAQFFLAYAADTGSANAYAVAPNPAIAAYVTGQTLVLSPGNANTGASTININALGTKNIRMSDGSDPYAGAMISGGKYALTYDGTNFVLQNEELGARLNAQTGTTYTLVSSDNGKIITCNNASAVTVTIPSSLKPGFFCTVTQKGAGQVTFSAASGGNIRNRNLFTKTAGQYASITLFIESNAGTAPEIYLGGDGA